MRKLFFFFAALVAFYYALISWIPNPFTPVRTLWQENKVIADGVVSCDQDPEVVIVGSSLSFVIKQSFLPDNYYNLGLSGMAAVDGLELLKRSKLSPKLILIESNHIERSSSSYFYAEYTPVSVLLKKYCFLSREENNPISNYAIPLVSKIGRLAFTGRWQSDSEGILKKEKNEEVYARRLQAAVQDFHNKPDSVSYSLKMSKLKDYIAYFSKNGSKVAFFEMPMDTILSKSNLIRLNSKAANDLSGGLVKCNDWQAYETTDGKHLTEEAGKVFLEKLVSVVDTLLSQ